MSFAFNVYNPMLGPRSPHKIRIGHRTFFNAEMALLALNATEEMRASISGYHTPGPAKTLFTRHKIPVVITEDMVRIVCRAKVDQHEDVRTFLLLADAPEFNYDDMDLRMGIDRNGKGDNWLGKAWEIVRSELLNGS